MLDGTSQSFPASSPEASSNAIYDRLAAGYGDAVDTTAASRLKYSLVLRHVGPEARVLDVGCANGLHMREIASHCREIVGVDINSRMLELAEDALKAAGADNARVQQMSATSLSFEDCSFDAAYSFSTLLLVPDAERAVAEMSRVLRPGGTAVLDITGRRNLSQRHWGSWYRTQGHPGVRSFTWGETCVLLDATGLDLVEAAALGFLDQWRYVPGLRRATFLERALHPSADRDVDLAFSNLPPVRRLANRWYVVCRKRG